MLLWVFLVLQNAGIQQKQLFMVKAQIKCTHTNVMISFLKIVFNSFWALIWNASRTYNDIKFCREAKAIIVVNLRLSDLFHEKKEN